jgi:AraC-like DNA-binding protein
MSRKRQTGIFDQSGDLKSAVTSHTRDYPAGHVVPLHFHDRDQLVYASRGVMTVSTRDGTWVVPPHRAVWIPARIPHTITMSGVVAMRTLYLRPRLAKGPPRDCGVILHQLETVHTIPLQLPHLSDPRLKRIAEILMKDPRDARTLTQLCRETGAGKRSVERLFQQEIGMTFGKWRQQLRLMHGMRLLAEGAKVTHAALESGYGTPSAFTSMFRKALGITPRSYFR